MKMKLITLTIMSGLLLTGCDQVKDSVDIYIKQIFLEGAFKLPSIAISPGWKINDHGSVAEVYGNKDCPTWGPLGKRKLSHAKTVFCTKRYRLYVMSGIFRIPA